MSGKAFSQTLQLGGDVRAKMGPQHASAALAEHFEIALGLKSRQEAERVARPGISISWLSSAVIWRNTPRLGPPLWNCPGRMQETRAVSQGRRDTPRVPHAHPDGLKNGIVLRAHIDIGLDREIVVGLELVEEGAELLR